jgi:hypothetical protein
MPDHTRDACEVCFVAYSDHCNGFARAVAAPFGIQSVAAIRTKRRRLVKAAAGVALSLVSSVLAACSPYAFSDDVQTLSTKMSSIDTSYQSTSQNITTERRLYTTLGWSLMFPRPLLMPSPGCALDAPGSETCELVLKTAAGKSANPMQQPVTAPRAAPQANPGEQACDTATGNPGPAVTAAAATTPLQPADLPPAALLKALDKYTAALAAVTKAQDRTDFDNAATKLDTAVGTLATAASPAAGPIAKASLNVIFWLVGQGLDYQRLEELRIGTSAACEPIHTLSQSLAGVLTGQRHMRLQGLQNILSRKIDIANAAGVLPSVGDQAYVSAIEDAQAAADAFQAVRVTDPAAAAQALSDAHDALVIAVRNNNGELKALIASLETFAQQADALATAVDASTAAPAKKSSSTATPAKKS